jgi:hypothetical protein
VRPHGSKPVCQGPYVIKWTISLWLCYLLGPRHFEPAPCLPSDEFFRVGRLPLVNMSSTSSSSGSSSSPSSSRSPSPIPEPSARSKKSKSKKSTAADEPRNEGVNPHWAFKPPSDAVLLDHNVDPEDFDWDAINDDEDIELWLVRAPAEVRNLVSCAKCR